MNKIIYKKYTGEQPVFFHKLISSGVSKRNIKKIVSFNTIKDKENKEMMDFIEEYLKNYHFQVKRIKKCLVAYNSINANIGFIGHTDTVNYESWDGSPFELQEKKDKLIGLGACDMKGGIAAILSDIAKIDCSKNKIALYLRMTKK